MSQLHTDRMLSWLIAAVAVGIYSTPPLLAASCGTGHTLPLGKLLLWWIITIPTAILARLVAKFHRDANDKYYLAKVTALDAVTLAPNLSDLQLGAKLKEILSDTETDLRSRNRLTTWSGYASDVIYWATYILAMVGFLYVVMAGIRCTPSVAPAL